MNPMVVIKRVIFVLIAVTVMGCSVRAQESSSRLAGNWVGVVEADGDAQFITISFNGKERIAGKISAPLEGFTGKFTSVQIDGSRIRCEVGEGAVKLSLAGEIDSDGISGEAEGFGRKGHFRLIKVVQIDPGRVAGYVGAHRFRNGSNLLIDSFPHIPNALMATDVGTGEVRAFFPISENKFIAGPALFVPYPTNQVISFRRRGEEVQGLERKSNSQRPVTARRIAIRREEVTFKSGDITLAGTLLLPPSKGRQRPAVIFTHGGGPALREWFWGLGYFFAAHGVAVLAYDKRGTGGSSGNWRQASFEELADDAVAAAKLLQSRTDIDEKKIGFWGLSQGGWIAPLAAIRFKDAAFAIALSGGGLSPAEQELFDTKYELRKAGMSQAEIEEALDFQIKKNVFMRTGENWDQYQEVRQRANGKRWFRFPGTDTGGPISRDDPSWASMRRFYFYDPAPTLRALKCPILSIFGELDSPDGVKANVTAMEKALQAGNQLDYTLKVYAKGRHNLMEMESPGQSFVRLKRFVPGLFEMMLNWVVRRVPRESRVTSINPKTGQPTLGPTCKPPARNWAQYQR